MATILNVSDEVLTLASGAPLLPGASAAADTTQDPEETYVAVGLAEVIGNTPSPGPLQGNTVGSVTFAGTYDSTKSYVTGQLVLEGGLPYLALPAAGGHSQTIYGHDPATSPTYWQNLVASPAGAVTINSPTQFSTPTTCLTIQGNGATDTAATQSTFIQWGSKITNPDANVRPVAAGMRFRVAPGTAPSVATDFHGLDVYVQADSGANVNTNTRIYCIEAHADNNTNTTMNTLVPIYGLVDVGAGGVSGSVSQWAASYRAGVNLSNGVVLPEYDGVKVTAPANITGGGTITNAYGLHVQSWTTGGATVTNPYAVYVEQQGGQIYTQENVVINNVSGTSSTSTPGLYVNCDNTKTGYAVSIANAGTGSSLVVNQTNATSAAPAVAISNAAAATSLSITQSGAASAVIVNQSGAQIALNVSSNNAGAAGFFPIQASGYDYGPSFTTSQNGGRTLTVTKSGTGSGIAFQVINKGTGDTVQWQIGSTPTTALKFTSLGSLVIGQGAQLATTATDGFVYLPSCAGAPTGAPTAQAGSVATVYDTTNNKLWVYNGAWKGVVLA